MDEKYFTKQAKLVSKVDVDRFYKVLFRDVMDEALARDLRGRLSKTSRGGD